MKKLFSNKLQTSFSMFSKLFQPCMHVTCSEPYLSYYLLRILDKSLLLIPLVIQCTLLLLCNPHLAKYFITMLDCAKYGMFHNDINKIFSRISWSYLFYLQRTMYYHDLEKMSLCFYHLENVSIVDKLLN